ncbi:NRDC protein, partial [Pseudoatta argentina]
MNYKKDYEESGPSTKRVKRNVLKAFCGLCVKVGSFNDPSELPGLAHLLERMVFMGSEKYPKLHVIWILPSILNQYRSKPYKYISSIIQYKGNGSLISYLRKKMWALDLYCGNCDNDNGFGCNSMYILFEITVELSSEGLNHWRIVLEAIFSFINLVKRTGPQECTYNEIYKIGKNNFRFFSKHDDVFDLCKNMHIYPSRDYLTGKHNYFEYNPKAIQECLDFLMPETANIMIFDDLDMNASYFKNYWSTIALPKEWIEHWKSLEPLPDFRLPSINAFLTDNFSLISVEFLKYPVKIYNDYILEIWYCPKLYWPICHINLHIISIKRVSNNLGESGGIVCSGNYAHPGGGRGFGIFLIDENITMEIVLLRYNYKRYDVNISKSVFLICLMHPHRLCIWWDQQGVIYYQLITLWEVLVTELKFAVNIFAITKPVKIAKRSNSNVSFREGGLDRAVSRA